MDHIDRSQADRDHVHPVVVFLSGTWCRRSDHHASPVDQADERLDLAGDVQSDLHDAWDDDDLPDGDAAAIWIFGLFHPAHDRCPGHGVSAAQRAGLLALSVRGADDVLQLHGWRGAGRRMVQLCAADREGLFIQSGNRLLGSGAAGRWCRFGSHRHQFDCHDSPVAYARHDIASSSLVCVDGVYQRVSRGAGDSSTQCRAGHDLHGPSAQCALLLSGTWRVGTPVAELFLDIWASGGLYPGLAGIRCDFGGHSGLFAEGDLRVWLHGRFDGSHWIL